MKKTSKNKEIHTLSLVFPRKTSPWSLKTTHNSFPFSFLVIKGHPIRIGWQQHILDWITVYTENWVYRHEFSFTRLIVEDMLFHWNLLQGCTHQSLWLESPKAQCSTFQSWDWWCTKGKVKVNRFQQHLKKALGWMLLAVNQLFYLSYTPSKN